MTRFELIFLIWFCSAILTLASCLANDMSPWVVASVAWIGGCMTPSMVAYVRQKDEDL